MPKDPKELTQAARRRSFNAMDQFGRLWLANIEVASGAACSPLVPAGWTDPLRTPAKYLKLRNAFAIQAAGSPVTVDFDRWIADMEGPDGKSGLQGEWKLRLYEIGRENNKVSFNPVEAETNEYYLHLAGPKPWPSAAVLRMAKAGHRELLGLAPLTIVGRKLLGLETAEDIEAGFTQPEQVKAAAPVPTADTTGYPEGLGWTEFVKYAKEQGHAKNMSEAAPLYNQYKQRQEA